MSKASQKAYETIRGRILSGEFAAGSHLKEEHLVRVCGVSRTPVRDALRSLAGEDYVRVIPNRGTFVNQWSPGDIEDIFSLRAMLEGYAARRAAERGSDRLCDELEACCLVIDKMLADCDPPDTEIFLTENRKFHALLKQAAASDRLDSLIVRLVEQPVVARTAISYGVDDLRRSNEHHHELVTAIRARNGDWAESVMKSHILAAFNAYRKTYGLGRTTESDSA